MGMTIRLEGETNTGQQVAWTFSDQECDPVTEAHATLMRHKDNLRHHRVTMTSTTTTSEIVSDRRLMHSSRVEPRTIYLPTAIEEGPTTASAVLAGADLDVDEEGA